MRPTLLSLAVVLLVSAAGPGDVVRAAPEREARLVELAGASGEREPLLRIGLADGRVVAIACSGAYRVVDVASGEPVWRERFTAPIHVAVDGAPSGPSGVLYRIQAGAFDSRAAAEAELERLVGRTGAEGIVHHDPDRDTWRVRLGRATDRVALGPLMDELRKAGLEGMWITEEPARTASGITLRLIDEDYASWPTRVTRLAIVPQGGERVEVDGKPYRGAIELRATPSGTVRPINWVNLENYLLGVVPAEMGPEIWPQLSALQAQAVAARTYAWRNREQFAEDGYDLCATPRCQVYGGIAVEHALSSRAVESTRGEIVSYDGRPIVALYTATCGGHTEDGVEIFPEQREPYLRGVPCRAEGEALERQRRVLRGRPAAPLVDESGADVTRDFALLVAAGIVEGSGGVAEALRPIDAQRLRRQTTALAAHAGLPPPAGPLPEVPTLAAAAAALVADLAWDRRAAVLLSLEDLPPLLRDPDLRTLGERERRALGYLAWLEAVRPFADGRFHAQRPASRARIAPLLVRIGDSYDAFGLQSAVFAGFEEGRLRLVDNAKEARLALAEPASLFGLLAGRASAVERLELWPGDRVRYLVGAAGDIVFLELQPPIKGVADDRSAKVYSWEVRKTRAELEQALGGRLGIGRLADLVVVRRGVSGRIVELKVVGSEGSTVVRGFDVRRLFDLRESLVVFEIQRDRAGEIAAVVFSGKGWGHGVGLCQVGAYGMALRGASYRTILEHYYRGVTLSQLVP